MSSENPPGVEPGGDLLTRYRLQDKIGESDHATVYRAEEIATGNTVAAKFLRTCKDRDRIPVVMAELSALIGFTDPHLVTVLDCSKEGVPCLVYEFCQGVGLNRLLEKHERLAPAAALRIAKGLCQALEVLHEKGFSHGDLKLSNVLLDRKGKAKLTDAGWKRVKSLSREGSVETFLEAEQQAEVRAIGSLLYQMLTGKTPVGGSLDLSACLADVPEELQDLLRSSQEGRYTDISTLLISLEPVVKNKAIGGRKSAYQALSARVLESGSRPAPRLDGGDSQADMTPLADEAKRRRSDVLRAVGAAGSTAPAPKRIPGLKVEMGKRQGPTFGGLFMAFLLGFGVLGGLGYLAHERSKEPVQAPPDLTVRPRALISETGNKNSSLSTPSRDSKDLSGLSRALIEETNATERIRLVRRLTSEFPEQAPDTLVRLLQGGNGRFRAQVLPFLKALDSTGQFRFRLLHYAADDDSGWPILLVQSLVQSNFQRKLFQEFEGKGEARGNWLPGADLAIAGSTAGTPTTSRLPLAVSARLEARFFGDRISKPADVLKEWIKVAGGHNSALAHWAAGTLVARAPDSVSRQAVLKVLGALRPDPALFQALKAALLKEGRGWEEGDQNLSASVLAGLAPPNLDRQELIDSTLKTVRGY